MLGGSISPYRGVWQGFLPGTAIGNRCIIIATPCKRLTLFTVNGHSLGRLVLKGVFPFPVNSTLKKVFLMRYACETLRRHIVATLRAFSS